ncbi:MAG: hypothetical protein AB8B96_19260 [Lysobacterales bacterium]
MTALSRILPTDGFLRCAEQIRGDKAMTQRFEQAAGHCRQATQAFLSLTDWFSF